MYFLAAINGGNLQTGPPIVISARLADMIENFGEDCSAAVLREAILGCGYA